VRSPSPRRTRTIRPAPGGRKPTRGPVARPNFGRLFIDDIGWFFGKSLLFATATSEVARAMCHASPISQRTFFLPHPLCRTASGSAFTADPTSGISFPFATGSVECRAPLRIVFIFR
jgi:hypothetical protein